MTADMPREIWAYVNRGNYWTNWVSSISPSATDVQLYIRADLAEKPAPMDAEVQEALANLPTHDICVGTEVNRYVRYDALGTLIRAATKNMGEKK